MFHHFSSTARSFLDKFWDFRTSLSCYTSCRDGPGWTKAFLVSERKRSFGGSALIVELLLGSALPATKSCRHTFAANSSTLEDFTNLCLLWRINCRNILKVLTWDCRLSPQPALILATSLQGAVGQCQLKVWSRHVTVAVELKTKWLGNLPTAPGACPPACDPKCLPDNATVQM